jgi:hypothetical protein
MNRKLFLTSIWLMVLVVFGFTGALAQEDAIRALNNASPLTDNASFTLIETSSAGMDNPGPYYMGTLADLKGKLVLLLTQWSLTGEPVDETVFVVPVETVFTVVNNTTSDNSSIATANVTEVPVENDTDNMTVEGRIAAVERMFNSNVFETATITRAEPESTPDASQVMAALDKNVKSKKGVPEPEVNVTQVGNETNLLLKTLAMGPEDFDASENLSVAAGKENESVASRLYPTSPVWAQNKTARVGSGKNNTTKDAIKTARTIVAGVAAKFQDNVTIPVTVGNSTKKVRANSRILRSGTTSKMQGLSDNGGVNIGTGAGNSSLKTQRSAMTNAASVAAAFS